MGKVFLFLADGHEEVEALTVVDLLRRAGIEITTVSVTGDKMIKSSHGVSYLADTLYDEINFDEADMLVLPGGLAGTKTLSEYEPLLTRLEEFAAAGRNISAICAAPTVFGNRGLLRGKTACCYPGMEDALLGANVVYDNVAVDGSIITGRGMGCTIDFALAIIEKLINKDKADEIAKKVVYHGSI